MQGVPNEKYSRIGRKNTIFGKGKPPPEKSACGRGKNDFANVDDRWRDEVDSLRKICAINGIDALVERSRSGRGAHLWIFFQKPIEATLARKFGNALLHKGAESVNLRSFRFYDRMLPMQDHLPKGGVGNMIVKRNKAATAASRSLKIVLFFMEKPFMGS